MALTTTAAGRRFLATNGARGGGTPGRLAPERVPPARRKRIAPSSPEWPPFGVAKKTEGATMNGMSGEAVLT